MLSRKLDDVENCFGEVLAVCRRRAVLETIGREDEVQRRPSLRLWETQAIFMARCSPAAGVVVFQHKLEFREAPRPCIQFFQRYHVYNC
jgi:hypothetical protein